MCFLDRFGRKSTLTHNDVLFRNTFTVIRSEFMLSVLEWPTIVLIVDFGELGHCFAF